MKSINIKGKEYIPVNERLIEFRKQHQDYSLESEVIRIDDNVCTIKAIIKDENGRVLATGIAQEYQDDNSNVNSFAYVENCETSAWGRVLGNFGIGIDIDIVSADEMQAKTGYTKKETLPDAEGLIDFLKSHSKPTTFYRDVKAGNYPESIKQQAIDIMYPKVEK